MHALVARAASSSSSFLVGRLFRGTSPVTRRTVAHMGQKSSSSGAGGAAAGPNDYVVTYCKNCEYTVATVPSNSS